ncbi:MAG: hypothetical protein PVF28_06110 [Thioalkalispiraceae bacterium]|jgi:hypothetical protein
MAFVNQFAYTQARLQAQHGLRPSEQTWQRLAGTGDLASYLQIARHTTIRDWVVTLHPASTCHDIESTLRQMFLSHVENVARWQPGVWRAAVLWVKQLVLLPTLRHLLAGEPVPDWLREDRELKAFTSENQNQRIQALQISEFAPVVRAWQKNTEPTEAWLTHWRRLWPQISQYQQHALDRLCSVYQRYLESLVASENQVMDRYTGLKIPLQYAFRNFSFQPAAAFAHLGLIALDVQQLRADLLQRCLFNRTGKEHP